MSLISSRTIKVDLGPIVDELKRLNKNLEEIYNIGRPQVTPEDFDVDDYSLVLYADEEKELIDQHLGRRVAGIDVGL